MRRIRGVKTHKKSKGSFFDTKEKIIGTVIAAIVVFILIAVLMLIESSDNQFVIKNNTGLKLEYVKAYFVDSEGPIGEGFNIENIEPNKSVVKETGSYALLNLEANYEIRFKFENLDEILVDAGYFNDNFDGKIVIDFEKSDDSNIVLLNVKAKNGLIPTKQIDCNETYKINLSEGYVEE